MVHGWLLSYSFCGESFLFSRSSDSSDNSLGLKKSYSLSGLLWFDLRSILFESSTSFSKLSWFAPNTSVGSLVVTLFLRSTLFALLKLTVFVLILSDFSAVFGSLSIFLDAVFFWMLMLFDFLFGYCRLIYDKSDSYLSKFCKYLILSWIFDLSTTDFWEYSNLSSDFWIY